MMGSAIFTHENPSIFAYGRRADGASFLRCKGPPAQALWSP